MIEASNHLTVFVITAFLFQSVLIIHFAMRKWHFEQAIRYGRFVYTLSLPAVAVSVILLSNDQSWQFWLAGFIYFIWAVFGYTVEYVRKIQWRNPPLWPILIPYVTLYLATVMFYWWPLANIYKPLWYIYAGLFVISTLLNITSHQKNKPFNQKVGTI
jgi:TctA family transporter